MDLFTRQADGRWVLDAYTDIDASIPLESIGCDEPSDADVGLGGPDGQAAMKLLGDSRLESTGVHALRDRDG